MGATLTEKGFHLVDILLPHPSRTGEDLPGSDVSAVTCWRAGHTTWCKLPQGNVQCRSSFRQNTLPVAG